MLARPEAAPPPAPKASDPAKPEIAWESFAAIVRELTPLFRRHWREIALNQKTVELDPDYERYMAMELAGLMHFLTVRVEGALVGYLFVGVGPHLHYMSTRWALVDMFWLDPLHRSGWTGVRMFREMEAKLRELGARIVHATEKEHFRNPAGRAVGVLLRRLGYKPIEVVWAKSLEP